MRSYVWRELARNPRRTLAAMAGVALGVGLFSGVLFFIDGSGATMTSRAVAPLAIDMQRVLTSPLGSGLRLQERLDAAGSLEPGQPVTVTLRVINGGDEPAHDVVVQDEAPPPLRYVAGTATLNGAPMPDVGGGSPLSQGVAGLGRNIGSVAPGSTVTITYRARAARAVRAGALRLRARVSSRESLVPTPANGPRQWTLEQLRARIASIPGVASADGLAFVDLPAGSLRARGVAARGTLRVFAFDARYRDHYPSIRITAGSLRRRSPAQRRGVARARDRPGRVGRASASRRPQPLAAGQRRGGPRWSPPALLQPPLAQPRGLPLRAAGDRRQPRRVRAAPSSPRSAPRARRSAALSRASRSRRSTCAWSGGVCMRIRPTALAQTRAVARSIGRIAPRQDYLIDNISNTLIVARADAAVGKRMFLFLGLPAVLLAAVLAAYAGGVLAAAQRREHATLRLRGAHRGHLRRLLAYRTLAVAGTGSAIGAAAGFLSALAILGSGRAAEGCARRSRALRPRRARRRDAGHGSRPVHPGTARARARDRPGTA